MRYCSYYHILEFRLDEPENRVNPILQFRILRGKTNCPADKRRQIRTTINRVLYDQQFMFLHELPSHFPFVLGTDDQSLVDIFVSSRPETAFLSSIHSPTGCVLITVHECFLDL